MVFGKIARATSCTKKVDLLIEKYPLVKQFPSGLELATQLVYPKDNEQNIRALAIVLVARDTDNASRICENYAIALEGQLRQVQINSFWGVQRVTKGKILNDNFVPHSDYKFIPELWRKLPAITFTDQHRQLITEAVQELDKAIPLHS